MRKLGSLVMALVVAFGFLTVSARAEKPKYTIKQVMKQAHGQKLLNKVVDGKASKEEKDKLLDLYLSLIENQPKKGEESSWMMKTGTLIIAAAAVSVDREGSLGKLKKAANCRACHTAHK